MNRQHFLRLLAGTAGAGLLGCGASSPPSAMGEPRPVHEPRAPTGAGQPASAPSPETRAICFDLFTLFDPRSLLTELGSVVGERAAAFADTWRVRQFEYAWLRASAGQYRDFRHVTGEALDYAEQVHSATLSAEQRETLIAAYSKLEPWPDTRRYLQHWKRQGLRLAPLANYSPRMLDELLAHSNLGDAFDARLSTDLASTFKPDPRAYALGVQHLALPKESIVFAAFGGWDAAGAKWFGYPTFWLNRLGVAAERLAPGPDATGSTLGDLARFIETR